MGARTKALILAGGAALFAAGFLLGRWTGETRLSLREATLAEPMGGTSAARATSGGGGGGDSSSPESSAPGGPREAGAADDRRGGPSVSNYGPGAIARGNPDSGGAEATRGAGLPPTGRTVTDVAAPGGGGGLAAPPARGADAPGRAAPPSPYALPERIRGRLLDAFSGQPVPGAKVSLLWELGDGTMSGGVASPDLDAEGWFTIEPREAMRGRVAWVLKERGREGKYRSEEDVLADVNYTLRASARGYETEEIGDPGPEIEVRIQPEGRDRLTGSIRVDARWPDGVRFGGRLLVEASSHDRQGFSQWALPDPDGTFLLVGVAPGKWGLRVAGRNHSGEELAVPEGGEARIRMRVPRPGVEEPSDAPKGEPREVEVSCGSRALGPYAFIRAEAKPGLFFRSEVVASAASFPALPAGKWTFVLQAPEWPEERFAADVPPGAGLLQLRFPDAPPEAAAPK